MPKTRAELKEQYHNDMMALAEAYENRLALIVTAQCAEIIAGDLPKKCPLCGAEPSAEPPVGDAALREALKRIVPIAYTRPTSSDIDVQYKHCIEALWRIQKIGEAALAAPPDAPRTPEIHTDRLQEVLALANEEAKGMGHEFVGTQHLLLGVLREGQGIGCAALAQLGFDPERLCDVVREQVLRLTGGARTPDDAPSNASEEGVADDE